METRQQTMAKPSNALVPHQATAGLALLQRKCACGGTPGMSGECEECQDHRLQRKSASAAAGELVISQPSDPLEREADRIADAVMNDRVVVPSTNASSGQLQRQTPPEPGRLPPDTKLPLQPGPSEEEKYKEAAKKIADALRQTTVGKNLESQAEELGEKFLDSVRGKVITGTAIAGVVAAVIGTNADLPDLPIPKIPLNFIKPGLKAKLTWEGRASAPKSASLTLTSESDVKLSADYKHTESNDGKPEEHHGGFTLTIPLGGSLPKKTEPSEAEKVRGETARMRAEQEKFREGLKTPAERAQDAMFLDMYWKSKARDRLGLRRLGGQTVSDSQREKHDDEKLSRKASSSQEPSTPTSPAVREVLNSPGQPLDHVTRSFFESRFGHDFSQVRVHSGAAAEQSAREVNANAYTVGHNIVFGVGRFAPGTYEGRRLLAHELTHVVQQSILELNVLSQAVGTNGVRIHGVESKRIQRNPTAKKDKKSYAGIIASQGIPLEKSVESTHWISETEKQDFIRDYIQYAKENGLTQQYQDAIKAYPVTAKPSSDAPKAIREWLKSPLPGPGSPRRVEPDFETKDERAKRSDEIDVDLETDESNSPNLPKVSFYATDPRSHSDFVERRCTAVGYGIYVGLLTIPGGGSLLYCNGIEHPILLPHNYVDTNLVSAEPLNTVIYKSREDALSKLPSNKPQVYAFYRAAGGLIVPTVFSPATTPRLVESLLDARQRLGKEVADELTVLALTMVGARLIPLVVRGLTNAGLKRFDKALENKPPSAANVPKLNTNEAKLPANEAPSKSESSKPAGLPGAYVQVPQPLQGGAGGNRTRSAQAAGATKSPIEIDPMTGVPQQLHMPSNIQVGPAYPTFEIAFKNKPHPGAHITENILRDKSGKEIARWWEVSESLADKGINKVGKLGDTEQKALTRVRLGPGMSLEIRGQHMPCTVPGGCDVALQVVAEQSGAEIVYRTTRGQVSQYPKSDF